MSPWTSFATTSESYKSNAGSDTLPPNVIRRFRDTYMPQNALESTPGTGAHKRLEPMEVASVTGPYYEAVPDPVIKDLGRGAGATRPLSSFAKNVSNDDDDGWWSEIGIVTRNVMITAGEDECFRDDILDFARRLQKAAGTQRAVKNSATVEGEAAVDIQVVLDDSFHAVLVSDFAFGIPPGVLAARLSGWLVRTLRN
jgi:acetyl esterase/lipase